MKISNLSGPELIEALERTFTDIKVIDKGRVVAEVKARAALRMVRDASYYGELKKNRVRAIVFCAPPPTDIKEIERRAGNVRASGVDSGMTFLAYPMASQSSSGPKYPALSRRNAGMGA